MVLSSEREVLESSEAILGATSGFIHLEETATQQPTVFYSRFEESMEMNADRQTVANYLDVHQEWFSRCARPMQVEPIGKNGYTLTIGRFGSFGYQVEPKISLDLKPAQESVYRIETIATPDYMPAGYDVDFKAIMELVEVPISRSCVKTRVQWQLDLKVYLWFPKFIRVLPESVIQNTGDRLLSQIVRQVSRHLTHKVKTDFHTTHNLPIPRKP